HALGILAQMAADVAHEPERARFEEARAGAALEQETHDVLLAGVRRDEERRVGVLVPRVREIRAGREQVADALGVAAPDGPEQIGDSAHEFGPASASTPGGYACRKAGVGWSASSQGPGKRPLSPFSENGRSRCHSLRGCS